MTFHIHTHGQPINRRSLLIGSLIPLMSACAPQNQQPNDSGTAHTDSSPTPSASASPNVPVSKNPITKPFKWDGPQTGLPGNGKYIAWTVDDGSSPTVVRAYAEFARRTATRLTFFINGQYPSFEPNLDILKPLVKSGQVQIGNHTYSHAALTSLDTAGIQDELLRNDKEIQRLFGVSSKPYFRPPYGYYNAQVLQAAADVGFSRATMWYGSLADSSPISSNEIYSFAQQYAHAQHILIGHLNYEGVISVLDKIKALLDQRGLTTVTLRDYYGG